MQGKEYIKNDANQWFDRNKTNTHNCFTEYLLQIFNKCNFKSFDVAEFGIGHCNNINLLSHYVKTIDGYDGSSKSLKTIDLLKQKSTNINGKQVNLGEKFEGIKKYDLIIYGFFTYMINDKEFEILINNSKKLLKDGGYIFIYDYLSKENNQKKDFHNKELFVYKRNLNFYLSRFKDFTFKDYRLFDNRELQNYLLSDIIHIDKNINSDDYNWTFSGLFKLEGEIK